MCVCVCCIQQYLYDGAINILNVMLSLSLPYASCKLSCLYSLSAYYVYTHWQYMRRHIAGRRQRTGIINHPWDPRERTLTTIFVLSILYSVRWPLTRCVNSDGNRVISARPFPKNYLHGRTALNRDSDVRAVCACVSDVLKIAKNWPQKE